MLNMNTIVPPEGVAKWSDLKTPSRKENPMENLDHELHVLAQAVVYKNMSLASQNIGLSQPQISRIIQRIESELDIHLIDRSSKRSSSWTPLALELSQLYSFHQKRFSQELHTLIHDQEPHALSFGTLEGLIPVACQIAHYLLKETKIESVELNVFDLSLLEESFMKQNLDLVLTSREPGRKKYAYNLLLGYQTFTQVQGEHQLEVFSTYEKNQRSSKAFPKKKTNVSKKEIVSNSLEARKYFIATYKAHGRIPSPILPTSIKAPGKKTPVQLLANDDFYKNTWILMENFLRKELNVC